MKKLLLLICFLPLGRCKSFAQPKDGLKQVFTNNEGKIMLLQLVAGFADGTNQAIQVHGLGAGDKFWDYNTSWKNKYNNYDAGDMSARFPFSKSALVWTTDGYHLTRFVYHNAMMATVIIAVTDLKDWKKVLRTALICTISNRLGFWLAYDNFFAR